MTPPPPYSISATTSPRDVPARAAARPAAGGRGLAVVDRGASFVVEEMDAEAAGLHRDAWIDLQARCLEPNVFLDPDFALPAALHLAAGRGTVFFLVWDGAATGPRRLVAVCPVSRPRDPLHSVVRVWSHNLAALGVPLLDATDGAAALRALLDWIRHRRPGCRAVLVEAVPTDGPTAALLADRAGPGLAVLATRDRAVLRRDAAEDRSGLAALSRKGAKELRRQRRRLADQGGLSSASARSGDDVRDAAERFLTLEAAGWKGAAGTALLSRPGETAFFRTMTRSLGRRGLCRVDALTLAGAPVAMAVVLTAGETDFFWKMAYDERLAQLSPGVQIVLDLTDAQRREGRAVTTDSCAMPDHPMIDRLWRDRLSLSDIAVSPRSNPDLGFRLTVIGLRLARLARASAKRGLMVWRNRPKIVAKSKVPTARA